MQLAKCPLLTQADIRNPRSVYSRWGRFQDADESACYEDICKRASIGVLSALAFDQGFA
jgi:hypothetical protein